MERAYRNSKQWNFLGRDFSIQIMVKVIGISNKIVILIVYYLGFLNVVFVCLLEHMNHPRVVIRL